MVRFRVTRNKQTGRLVGRRIRPLNTRQKSQVKRIVASNIETKTEHHTLTSAVTSAPEYFNIMNQFIDTQGVTSEDFIGKEIRLQTLRMKGRLKQADTSNVIRVIMFQARGDYSPSPGSLDIFHSSANPLYSMLNKSFVKNVRMDRLYVLNTSHVDDDGVRIVSKTVNFKNRRLLLQAVADSTQLWYVCFLSDSTFVGHPDLLLNMALSWKDA